MINFGSTDLKIKRTLYKIVKKIIKFKKFYLILKFEWRISNWNSTSSFELEKGRMKEAGKPATKRLAKKATHLIKFLEHKSLFLKKKGTL